MYKIKVQADNELKKFVISGKVLMINLFPLRQQ